MPSLSAIADVAAKRALDRFLHGDSQTLTRYARETLATRVASHLAGRPCLVKWERPREAKAPNAIGLCTDALGGAILSIDPELGGYDAYRVLLHEAAHARLHWHPTPTTDPPDRRLKLRPDLAAIVTDAVAAAAAQREAEANAQAWQWARWAKAHAKGPALGQHLEALLDWAPGK